MIRKTFHGPEYFEAAIQRAGSLETALRQSSVYEDTRIIEELLFPYSIAFVKAMDELDDEDAAQQAALGSFKAMMDVYLRHGGDPTLDLKGYTLIDMDAKPDVPVVEHLLQCGARPDVVDPCSGYSPLHWACAYCEDTETWLKLFFKVPLLDLNVRTQYPGGYKQYAARRDSRSTPLHLVSTASAALMLLEHGAFVNSFDRLRWTPLFATVFERNPELYPSGESIKLMRVLLEHGAWVNHHSAENETAASVLCEDEAQDIELVRAKLELLFAWGAEQNPVVGLDPQETLLERLKRQKSQLLPM
jgi:hypothetical protein